MTKTTPTAAPQEPPVLLGLDAIAGFLGMTPRQLRQIASKGDVPLFKLKRSGLLAARPESLRTWLAQEEAAALAGAAQAERVHSPATAS